MSERPAQPPEAIEAPKVYTKPDPRSRGRRRRRFHWSDTWIVRRLLALVPYLYEGYMAFVNGTSRHTDIAIDGCMWERIDRGANIVGAVLHEDVFHVADRYKDRNVVTMASYADAGATIARFLERAEFVTFRGSPASPNRDRGGRTAAEGITTYLAAAPDGHLCGITVDGSKGPARVVKDGAVHIARDAGCEIFALHVRARRNVHLNTWDRTRVPLPFNHIVTIVDGPFRIARDADDEAFERVRLQVQDALVRVAEEAERFFR